MTTAPDSFLAHMIERRRTDVAAAYGGLTHAELEGTAAAGRPVRDFEAALTSPETVAVIAEVKKASPSAGRIAPDVVAAEQARRYEEGGAAAVSVLTEPSVFGGSFDDLAAVAAAVDVPVLCKDFVVDEAQALVARGCGADAVLLMLSVLGASVESYLDLVRELGMQALVEVASRAEVGVALRAGATLVGVNSRDLHSLRVDAEAARELVAVAKAGGATTVLASGVKVRADVEAAVAAGADAVLVGETLMRVTAPEDVLADLANVARRTTAR